MHEITELDNKYAVVKWEDLFNADILTTEEYDTFRQCLHRISEHRKRAEKHDNKYVVLNLEDEANIDYLLAALESRKKDLKTPYISMKDISIDLVNAVLIAGNP